MFIGKHLENGIEKIVIRISRIAFINRILENRIHLLDRIMVKEILYLSKIGFDIKRNIIISRGNVIRASSSANSSSKWSGEEEEEEEVVLPLSGLILSEGKIFGRTKI
nr:hypothetical protein [Tanacetum cinerariifolium]